MANSYRIGRLENLIREKVGAMIVDGSIKDPRVDAFLSVTRVKVSKDISFADVYVSSYKTEKGVEKGAAGLQSAAGFIQSRLAREIRVRQTPRLRFHADTGLREGFEMIKKIEALETGDQSAGEARSEASGETGPAGLPDDRDENTRET